MVLKLIVSEKSMLETRKMQEMTCFILGERQSHKLAGRGRDKSSKGSGNAKVPKWRESVPGEACSRETMSCGHAACGLNEKTYETVTSGRPSWSAVRCFGPGPPASGRAGGPHHSAAR